MGHVENQLRLLKFDKASDLMDEIDASLAEHQRKLDQAAVVAAGAEQDELLAEHGIETARTASGVGQRHGLIWLIDKGRVTGARKRAGEAWSADYSLVRTDGLRSCLNDNAPGAAVGDDATAQTKKARAFDRLACARRHIIAATGSARLADLMDAVCGRGETLRSMAGNDKDQALLLETQLLLALDMTAVSYQIVKVAA